MVDCLAATGTDDFLLFMVIAAVLLAAGIIGLAIANKKARWSAFAVVPLLLGLTLAGTGAQPVQAADLTTCSSSPSPPASPATTPTATSTPTVAPTPAPTPAGAPSPTPIPAEPPACEPTVDFPDVETSADLWIDGSVPNTTVADWSVDDVDTVQALLAAVTDPHPTASVSVDVVYLSDDGNPPVTQTVSFDIDEYTNVFTPADGHGALTLSSDSFRAGIDAQAPDSSHWVVLLARVTLPLPYDNGCEVEIAALSVEASFPLS